MELFKDTNFDFLGKKWPFIIVSLLLTAAGILSLMVKGGPKYGIDFRGGALMYVKFNQQPPVEKIRSVISAKISGEISVVTVSNSNEVEIGTQISEEKTLNANRQVIEETLAAAFNQNAAGKFDVNNAGAQALAGRLRDPLQRANISFSEEQLQDTAKAIVNFKNTPPRSGLLNSFDELSAVPGITPQIIQVMKQEFSLAPFTIRQTEVVGPRVGGELRTKALLATLYALAGMLVYIAFRFEWIYGVAAVIAVFHDTVITIGLFSLFGKEISLTVVAALLTLVGYSMNDTIVVFDRIRENLKLMRREKFEPLVNASINQTLSRTILTSGLTFLTALSLFLFGGQVLNGFAFALVAGIIVGTYSSIFIASPILVFWQNYVESRKHAVRAPVPVPEKKEKTVTRR
jgi:preprotein translocase subunit SecF